MRFPTRRPSKARALVVATVAISLLFAWMPDAHALGTLSWSQLSPAAKPSPRHWGAMAYDEANHELVLFGGYRNGTGAGYGFLSDTWTYNGTTWTQKTPSTVISGRDAMAMTYDPNSGHVIMFGGWDGAVYRDEMYSWDGSNWTNITPETHPSARGWTGMAVLPTTNAVILYGGWNGSDLEDTWSWNGTNWGTGALTPTHKPGKRDDFAMVTDPTNNKVVLFGGGYYDVDPAIIYRDTWTFDGTDWTQAATTGPSKRTDMFYTFDQRLGRVVVFGGYYYNPSTDTDLGYQDTWSWSGTAWSLLAPGAKPTPRDSGFMAYFPPTGKTVLFGGYLENVASEHDLNDTWVLNLATQSSAPAVTTATSATKSFAVSWGAPGAPTSYVVQYARRTLSSGTWVTGAWTNWKTVAGTVHSAVFTGVAGNTYLFHAKAIYPPGDIATGYSAAVTSVVPFDERASAVTFSTGWSESSSASRYLGTFTSTTSASKTMTFKAAASAMWLIGDKCASCGKMKVYVDGTLISTVDTYRSSTAVRQILFSKAFVGTDTHTIKIVTLGTSGRPKIVIDAIGVRR
jgi:hypothetical protein